ncbi:hypothetical protein [Streptomyces sp. NPDC000618]|uniref:hypothetical protein n=1 Tax=Streptomyces sp. NPDC000618 TaxID=3154265 RepID=UPI00331BA7A5
MRRVDGAPPDVEPSTTGGPAVKRCERCGQPIRSDERYTTVIPDSMSAARPSTYTHAWDCKPPRTVVIPRSR